MQSPHEFERRAEVHRLLALKKIDALSESAVQEQALGSESSTDQHESTEAAAAAAAASHQQR